MSDEPRVDSRQYPERPIVGVGAVIVEAGKVLLVKRRYEPLAGRWSIPGGTLELGETLEDGVARELREETGLDIEVGPVIEVFDRIILDPERRVRYHFVLVDYLCRVAGGRLDAGTDAAAVVIADAAHLAPFDLTQKALDVIARGMELATVKGEGKREKG